MTRILSVLLVAVALLAGASPAAGSENGRVKGSLALCSFRDPRILESSGLVDGGRLLFTTNDSGDGPYLYGVSKATGRTVVTTTYSTDRPTDVEALAPGEHGTVWVADIGDYTVSRSSITVYQVPERGLPQQVSAPRYTLSYPDGPHNAETLLVPPGTSQLYVVTKSFFGGAVYAAPAHLDARRTNVLRKVADVPGRITDGAFLPDGSHVLLRTYGAMTLFSFPGFQDLGSVELPPQRLGEALAVSPGGHLYLSSEGRYSRVLEVSLPDALARKAGDPGTATLAPSPSVKPSGPGAAPTRPGAVPRPGAQREAGGPVDSQLWTALGVLGVAVVIWALLTFALPRSRRRQ
jgi:hypothetical protein